MVRCVHSTAFIVNAVSMQTIVPRKHLPTREEVRNALRGQIAGYATEWTSTDVLTFAGNGEPTVIRISLKS
jgi:wyosine [tRNA(Phe)-imidazoG37] synthetase (radical SAM superfamily)